MTVRYTDHAANQRTFLAWGRTALAVMTFGALFTRWNALGRSGALAAVHHVTSDAGTGCVAAGVLLFGFAYRRYRNTRAWIGCDRKRADCTERMEGALCASLALIGSVLLWTMLVSGAR